MVRADVEVEVGQGHIIERPRLLKLLDETEARIVLLVAPAGYGKTTLARQWSRGANTIWIDAARAVPDPASLALDLADGLHVIYPDGANTTRQRLTAAGAPEADAPVLASLLKRQFPVSADIRIIIDDFQSVSSDHRCRALLDELVRNGPGRYLICSRSRPDGYLAREVVEGSCAVLDYRDLAFTPTETRSLLPNDERRVEELVALSKGWPAVIGVAARRSIPLPPPSRVEEHLYDYFVGELLLTLTASAQRALERLAVTDAPPRALIEASSTEPDRLVSAALELAVLQVDDTRKLMFHPLARRFLSQRLRDRPPDEVRSAAADASRCLTSEHDWDAAFAVVSEFCLPHEAEALLDACLDDLLAHGRVRTLRRWLDAEVFGQRSPIVDIARAEIALRDGQYARAEALSARAADGLTAGPRLFRATFLGGRAAHLRENGRRAAELFAQAADIAATVEGRTQALCGLFNAALDSEDRSAAADAAAELQASVPRCPDDAVRARIAQILYGNRLGSRLIDDRMVTETLSVLEDVADPMVRTNALNTLAHWHVLTGRYDRARALAELELEEALDFGLSFVVPHGLNILAAAEAGRARFREALAHLEAARDAAAEDVHVEINAANLEIRILVACRRAEAAVAVPMPDIPTASPSIRAELVSARALALACHGDAEAASELAHEALDLSVTSEPQVTSHAVLAICALSGGEDGAAISVKRLEEAVADTGNVDSFITALRSFPKLATATRDVELRRVVAEVLRRNSDRSDRQLVRELSTRRDRDPLSAREVEVLALVAEGATNAEIAQSLFISESTVKAHLQNIFGKLGVRTRTQAALRYRETG